MAAYAKSVPDSVGKRRKAIAAYASGHAQVQLQMRLLPTPYNLSVPARSNPIQPLSTGQICRRILIQAPGTSGSVGANGLIRPCTTPTCTKPRATPYKG
eukprot:3109657-Rhodomonas_salina.6